MYQSIISLGLVILSFILFNGLTYLITIIIEKIIDK